MRIRDEYIKSVGFVSRGGDVAEYKGTAFFVLVKSGEETFNHLVTAAHVARHLDGYGCTIGFNGTDGMPRFLNAGNERWFYHPTEADSVDVAVMPFAIPNEHDYDITAVSSAMFVSDESILNDGTGIGDEVSTIGLFTKFFGKTHFIPIVRTGNIAMMPKDKVTLSGFGDAEAYLVEGRSIGGLSGSPVFWRQTISMPGTSKTGEDVSLSGLGKIGLLGLLHGHWDLPASFSNAEKQEAVNMGISIVVPAKKILETLHHPELVKLRKARSAL